jgi:hypothetical protein
MTEIVGTDGEFTTDEITYQIRNIIVQQFSQTVAGSGIPVARHGGEHGRVRQTGRRPHLRHDRPNTA